MTERRSRTEVAPVGVDLTVPSSARLWNYWLGGKDHFAIDRKAGDEILAVYPQLRANARASRAFLGRAVRFLAGEVGIRQFLDIGTGLPTADNTHEVAQRVAPDARVVYVDNDPLVLAHARALLVGSPEGETKYVHADLRDPDLILTETATVLDLDQPIALLLLGILGHVEYGAACGAVRTLLDHLPSGSHLVVGDAANTSEAYNEASAQFQDRYEPQGGVSYEPRSHEQISGYFAGLELVEPGVVFVHEWRPEPSPDWRSVHVDELGGVGRKP
ncbi:SAM-dependent methyltransferase [Pseudonocardia lacus]|uniref:SAM-dependent methyltransferase n=1 Tax=Pseudonocardia lacus TaxID=2835865 RepID=UPI001BDBCE24|nr:SAM-dependent methyltransferase [Pseudonocardia lacus]